MSYLGRPIANRGVHLRITPRPANLGESREILRLLSQFGEIDYFKNLKYDGKGLGLPSVSLVIYKDEEGAKSCFRGSPVRFRMGKVKAGQQSQSQVKEEVKGVAEGSQSEERPGGGGGAWGLGGAPTKKSAPFGLEPEPQHQRRYSSTTSLPTPTPRPIRMPFDPPSPVDTTAQKAEEEDRIFQTHTSSTHRNFRDIINMGHYYSGFAIDSKMPGQADLQKRVPSPGLSCVDWRAVERPWRMVREERARMKPERLGSIWEMEGKKNAAREEAAVKRDALGVTEEESVGSGGRGGRKFGMSWADVGIK